MSGKEREDASLAVAAVDADADAAPTTPAAAAAAAVLCNNWKEDSFHKSSCIERWGDSYSSNQEQPSN